MKKICLYCVLLLSFLLLCVGCTSTMDIHSLSFEKQMKEAQLFEEHKLIIMEDNQYQILVSKEDALAYGISHEVYDLVKDEVARGNRMLRELIESEEALGNTVIIEDGTDEECDAIAESFPLVKSGSETIPGAGGLPSGTINTNGIEYGYDGCFAPYEMRSVKAHCFSSGALWPLHVVTTRSLGTTFSKTHRGSGYVSVSIAASNTSCTIGFATSSSGGGVCAWEGQTTILNE